MNESSFIMSDDSDTDEEAQDEIDEMIMLPSNRYAWERDSKCKACYITFDIQGVAHTKKSYCFFCYRGICMRCLNFTRRHPETKKKQKMCVICHNEFKIVKMAWIKIQQAKYDKDEVLLECELASKEKERITNNRKVIEETIKSKKKKMNLSEEGQTKKAENLRKINEELVDKIEKLRVDIRENQAKSSNLSGLCNSFLEEERQIKEKLSEKEKAEKEYRQEIADVKQQTLLLMQDSEKYTKESTTTENALHEVSSEISKLSSDTVVIKEKIKDKEHQLAILKKKVSSNSISIEELNQRYIILSNESNEVTEEPVTESDMRELEIYKEKLESYERLVKTLNGKLNSLRQEEKLKRKELTDSNRGSFNVGYQQSETLARLPKNDKRRAHESSGTSCQKCWIF